MSPYRQNTRALAITVAAVVVPVTTMLAVGVGAAQGKPAYEIVRDLFIPMVGPTVAFLLPIVLFFVIPLGQSRQRLSLDLCTQYYNEEMRAARNIGWKYFVVESGRLGAQERLARQTHFLHYLCNPEVHRVIDPETDTVYQRISRVLDFFSMTNDCLARGLADPGIVRNFLIFYYVWWRDEIMDPIRAADPAIVAKAKVKPVWWQKLKYLDELVGG